MWNDKNLKVCTHRFQKLLAKLNVWVSMTLSSFCHLPPAKVSVLPGWKHASFLNHPYQEAPKHGRRKLSTIEQNSERKKKPQKHSLPSIVQKNQEFLLSKWPMSKPSTVPERGPRNGNFKTQNPQRSSEASKNTQDNNRKPAPSVGFCRTVLSKQFPFFVSGGFMRPMEGNALMAALRHCAWLIDGKSLCRVPRSLVGSGSLNQMKTLPMLCL